MKKQFVFKTAQEAHIALEAEIYQNQNVNYVGDDIYAIDFWFKEFIRDEDEDIDWLNHIININLGHDCIAIKAWFYYQCEHPELWTDKSFELIRRFSDEYNSFEY